jgi:hypothetical protein
VSRYIRDFTTASKAWHRGKQVPGQVGGPASLPGAFELRIFQGALRHEHQAFGFERLLNKIVGAAFNGGNSSLGITVTGDHHNRQFGMLLFEAFEQLKTVEPAAFQPNIEENEIRPTRNDSGQCFVAVTRRARIVSLVLQDPRHQFADVRFVVNDQDVGCHGVGN